MDFKIDNGPWKPVYTGKFGDHEIEVITNPRHIFLIFVYENVGEKRVGALVEGYKAFVGRGAVGAFAETMPKSGIGIIKSFNKNTEKMLFLALEPLYMDLLEEDFLR